MWTTSNSHAERIASAMALFLVAACAATQQSIAPDAPREGPRMVSRPPIGGEPRDLHIEVTSATIRRAADDPELLRQLVPGDVDVAGAFIIDARIDRPFGDPHRDALIAIVLNGRPLTQTVAITEQRLAALITARDLAPRRSNTVAVTVLGDRTRTTSRKTIEVPSPEH